MFTSCFFLYILFTLFLFLSSLSALYLLDSLVPLKSEEKQALYLYREFVKTKPNGLAKFLLSVDWAKPEQVAEAYRYKKKERSERREKGSEISTVLKSNCGWAFNSLKKTLFVIKFFY